MTYDDEFTEDFSHENATGVAVAMLDVGIGDDGCRQCRENCVDRLDFSLSASSTARP